MGRSGMLSPHLRLPSLHIETDEIILVMLHFIQFRLEDSNANRELVMELARDGRLDKIGVKPRLSDLLKMHFHVDLWN